MRVRNEQPITGGGELCDYFFELLRDGSEAFDCLPGEVLNNSRKSAGVARCRRWLTKTLRETVSQYRSGGVLHFKVWRDGRPDTCDPISFPTLGRLIGVSHSALVLAAKKNRECPETLCVPRTAREVAAAEVPLSKE